MQVAKRKTNIFKDPSIIRCKNGDWYVQYYFKSPTEPTKWLPFKERSGINYIKDPEEKEKEADLLRKDILHWLKDGNSPFDDVDPNLEKDIADKEKQAEKISRRKIIWSLNKAIEKYKEYLVNQKLSVTTVRTYKRYLDNFERWIIKNDITDHKACLFNEMQVQDYLEQEFKEVRKDGATWSARTFNNYLDFMATFFNKLQDLEKQESKNRNLKYDFQPNQLKPKNTIAQRNKALTPVLFEKIKDDLDGNTDLYGNLRDYLEWIFLSFMRPGEIRELRVKDIDLMNRQIRIIGKTGDRIIPISDQLRALIKKRKIEIANINDYVFGYMGKVDHRRMSVEYFPSQFSAIREKFKLDANYGPYSYKPTGVIRMIHAGFSDREIMELTGHKTQEAFAAYKRDLIIDNSHVMKGKTVDF